MVRQSRHAGYRYPGAVIVQVISRESSEDTNVLTPPACLHYLTPHRPTTVLPDFSVSQVFARGGSRMIQIVGNQASEEHQPSRALGCPRGTGATRDFVQPERSDVTPRTAGGKILSGCQHQGFEKKEDS